MIARALSLLLLSYVALATAASWNSLKCKICANCTLTQTAQTIADGVVVTYPYSPWIVADCNGTGSVLNGNECVGVSDSDGSLVSQDGGHFWEQLDKEKGCSHHVARMVDGLTRQCTGRNDTATAPALLFANAFNVTEEGILTCFDHIGTALTGPDLAAIKASAKRLVSRSAAHNSAANTTASHTEGFVAATAKAGSAMNATISGCAAVPTRAFRPSNATGSICDAGTTTDPFLSRGVRAVMSLAGVLSWSLLMMTVVLMVS